MRLNSLLMAANFPFNPNSEAAVAIPWVAQATGLCRAATLTRNGESPAFV